MGSRRKVLLLARRTRVHLVFEHWTISRHAPPVTGDEHCAEWFHRIIKDKLQINISILKAHLAPRNLDKNMALCMV